MADVTIREPHWVEIGPALACLGQQRDYYERRGAVAHEDTAGRRRGGRLDGVGSARGGSEGMESGADKVEPRATRRRLSAAYKARIVEEVVVTRAERG